MKIWTYLFLLMVFITTVFFVKTVFSIADTGYFPVTGVPATLCFIGTFFCAYKIVKK